MSKILIADDEEEAIEVLTDFLSDLGHYTAAALNGEEAVHFLRSESYDILILDLRMPRISGEGVMAVLKDHSPQTEVIIATGYSDSVQTRQRMKDFGVKHYIEKPIDLEILEKIINSIKK
jgi:CheY-like chemotaxis protein